MSSIALPTAPVIRASEYRESLRPLALAAPLLVLLIISFALPIVALLSRAIYDPTIANALPLTSAALLSDSGSDIPGEPVFHALATDLIADASAGNLYEFAKSLNARLPGARSQILRTARVAAGEASIGKDAMIQAAPLLGRAGKLVGDPKRYASIHQLLPAQRLRSALDGGGRDRRRARRRGGVQPSVRSDLSDRHDRHLGDARARISARLSITNLQPAFAEIVLVLVLLPFWTSILVRTAAWTVILQKFGLLNDALLWLHLTSHRLDLMYTRTGLIIAMTHIQLPFTLLPIYSVMRAVQPTQVRAAQSLGARPLASFVRVYLPQVMPGVLAGCLLTFILCLGYYITPVLIGGGSDQLISNFIANYVNVELNWEMAAALSFVLLAATLGLYVTMTRYLGLDLFKMG